MDWLERRAPYEAAHRAALGEVFEEMSVVVTSMWEQQPRAVPVASVFDRSRWDRQLGDRLLLRNKLTAEDFGRDIAGSAFDPADLDGFLISSSAISAANINGLIEDDLQGALAADEPGEAIGALWGVVLGSHLDQLATSTVTTASNFGQVTAARQTNQRTKTWVVNSGNARPAHAAMGGSTVPLGSRFGNGMDYPGDPAGGADNNANCRCSMSFSEG